jgi:glutamate/aspartate transport system substrate-binding protein
MRLTFATAVCALLAAVAAAAPLAAQPLPTAERGTLTLGVRDDAFPFSYRAADGRHTGFSIELCQRIVQALEQRRGRPMAVRQLVVTSRNRIAHLLAGNIDLECGSTTNTRSRTELGVTFSLVIFVSDIAAMAPRAMDTLQSVDDLARLQATDPPVLGVVGTTAVPRLPALRQRLGARFAIAYAPDNDQALHLLGQGQASAFVTDRVLLAARLAAGGDAAPWRLLLGTASPDALEHYGLMMRDTAADAPLKQQADDTLRAMMQSGEFEALYARWFLQAVDAPAGSAAAARPMLGMAMTPALRQLLRQPSDKAFDAAAAPAR